VATGAVDTADRQVEAAWRLRDLGRASLVLAGVIVALLAVPFALSAGRALADGWVPSGDEAIIAIRVHDVLGLDPPLTGLPSTSDLYGERIATNHPGPIEFYLLALPVRVLGPSVGMLVGAGALNLGAVLVTLWVVLRRAGPAVALWAAVLLAATIWSTGNAVLTDPISSNIGGYALLCTAVLAWALACGDHRLLPLAALVSSFVAQQHLAIVAAAGVVAGWGLVALLIRWWRERRRRPVAPADRRWLWALGAAGVALVLWTPVAVDQVTGDPGNITAVARYARQGAGPSLGLGSGATQVARVAGLPPYMTRHDLTGGDVSAPVTPLALASGSVTLAAMVAIAIGMRRRTPALALLAGTALVLAVAGLVTGASVPDSLEQQRINLYRWTWALAFCVWVALGWAAARVLEPRLARFTRLAAAGRLVAVGVVVAVVAAAVVSVGPDDLRRDRSVYTMDDHVAGAAAAATEGDGPVVILTEGGLATLSVGPAVAAHLVDAGAEVQVPRRSTNAYGDERAFDAATAGTALVLVSSFGPSPPGPGRFVASAAVTPAIVGLLDQLIAQARREPIRPSARAATLLARFEPGAAGVIRAAVEGIDTSPSELASRLVLDLLRDGYLESPRFDPTVLDRLLRLLPDESRVWGDDRVAMYELTIDELRTYRPDLFG